jgi:hypothetical protein
MEEKRESGNLKREKAQSASINSPVGMGNICQHRRMTRMDAALAKGLQFLKVVVPQAFVWLAYFLFIHGALVFCAIQSAGSAWGAPWQSPYAGWVFPLAMLSFNPMIWLLAFVPDLSSSFIAQGGTPLFLAALWIPFASAAIPAVRYLFSRRPKEYTQ